MEERTVAAGVALSVALLNTVVAMGSGCIAMSGPPGAGKTTALTAFLRHRVRGGAPEHSNDAHQPKSSDTIKMVYLSAAAHVGQSVVAALYRRLALALSPSLIDKGKTHESTLGPLGKGSKENRLKTLLFGNNRYVVGDRDTHYLVLLRKLVSRFLADPRRYGSSTTRPLRQKIDASSKTEKTENRARVSEKGLMPGTDSVTVDGRTAQSWDYGCYCYYDEEEDIAVFGEDTESATESDEPLFEFKGFGEDKCESQAGPIPPAQSKRDAKRELHIVVDDADALLQHPNDPLLDTLSMLHPGNQAVKPHRSNGLLFVWLLSEAPLPRLLSSTKSGCWRVISIRPPTMAEKQDYAMRLLLHHFRPCMPHGEVEGRERGLVEMSGTEPLTARTDDGRSPTVWGATALGSLPSVSTRQREAVEQLMCYAMTHRPAAASVLTRDVRLLQQVAYHSVLLDDEGAGGPSFCRFGQRSGEKDVVTGKRRDLRQNSRDAVEECRRLSDYELACRWRAARLSNGTAFASQSWGFEVECGGAPHAPHDAACPIREDGSLAARFDAPTVSLWTVAVYYAGRVAAVNDGAVLFASSTSGLDSCRKRKRGWDDDVNVATVRRGGKSAKARCDDLRSRRFSHAASAAVVVSLPRLLQIYTAISNVIPPETWRTFRADPRVDPQGHAAPSEERILPPNDAWSSASVVALGIDEAAHVLPLLCCRGYLTPTHSGMYRVNDVPSRIAHECAEVLGVDLSQLIPRR